MGRLQQQSTRAWAPRRDMPAERHTSYETPKTLWLFRQVAFLFSAFFIHILRRCSRESADLWSKKARFFSTQLPSLANAAYLRRSAFATPGVSFKTVNGWTWTVTPEKSPRDMSIDR